MGLGFCKKHYMRFKAHGHPLTILHNEDGQGTTDKFGYKIISTPEGRMMEHRWIMRQHLKRKLKPGHSEVVHHINGNTSDNRIENLKVISQSEHTILHCRKSIIVDGKKLCLNCRQFLPMEEFPKSRTQLLGKIAVCRPCYNFRHKKYV